MMVRSRLSQTIFKAGAPASNLYILESGQVPPHPLDVRGRAGAGRRLHADGSHV
jgi:hypothetical protein